MVEKKEEKKGTKIKRPSAKKRDIQHTKRELQNRSFRSKARTAMRTLEEKPDHLNVVYSLLDKGVKKGVFKKNKANRLKSKLSKKTAKIKAV
jgi:small subunit ribosomal protein S20